MYRGGLCFYTITIHQCNAMFLPKDLISWKLSKIWHEALSCFFIQKAFFKYLRLWSCVLICNDRSSLSVYFSAYVSNRSLHLLIFIIYNFPIDIRLKTNPHPQRNKFFFQLFKKNSHSPLKMFRYVAAT